MNYSTEDYLTQLESDRSDFIDNLTTKGITGLTGDETFTELVPEVLNIPSGGSGVIINGTLENKEIGSGSVSKGDILTSSYDTTTIKLNNASDYTTNNATITNPDNIIDNDENTYGQITGSGSSRIYCKLNISSLNIPNNSKIKSVYINCKVATDSTSLYNVVVVPSLIKSDEFANTTTCSVASLYGGATNLSVDTNPVTGSVLIYNDTYYSVDKSIASSIGAQLYVLNAKLRVYTISFTVEYEDKSVIKTITNNEDTIVGIANENGTAGDTIQVYVPNASA